MIGGGWYAYREARLDSIRATVQSILDEEEQNQIKVIGVAAPNSAFLPFVGPSEFTSFVLVGDKEGKLFDRPECPSVAEYRYITAGSNWLVEMKMRELRACQAAMAVASK